MDRRVLQYAFAQRKDGGKSAYYLGCLFYGRDNREEGVKCWEVSVTREDGLHQAHRCMALALLEVFEDKVGARREMEKAFVMHQDLSLIHISEPTRLGMISYAVFCLKKKSIMTVSYTHLRAHETDY